MFSSALVISSGTEILNLFGPFSINVYGVFAFLGVLTLFVLSSLDASRQAIIDLEQHSSIFVWMVIGGVLGARLLNVLANWRGFMSQPADIFKIWDGGLSLMGGLIAVVLVGWICTSIAEIDSLQYADLMSIYAPLMQAIARIGCFFAGCCYGAPLSFKSSLLGVVYKNPMSLAPTNICLHPVQLYSVALSGCIFFGLFLFSRFQKAKPGVIFCLYLFCEGLARAAVDLFRGPSQTGSLRNFMLPQPYSVTLSQTLAIFVAIMGLGGLTWLLIFEKQQQEKPRG